MPIFLPQGNVAVSDVICRRITFVGDNSEQSTAAGGSGPITPDRITLPQVNEPLTPTLAFGDGDSGFFESADDNVSVSIFGIKRFEFTAAGFSGFNANSFTVVSEAATATNPTLIPNKSDLDTGIGWVQADQLSLVAGGLNCISVSKVAGARRIGFYDGSPVALQTGVAVTTAAIHAALVSLRLITA